MDHYIVLLYKTVWADSA